MPPCITSANDRNNTTDPNLPCNFLRLRLRPVFLAWMDVVFYLVSWHAVFIVPPSWVKQ